MGLVTLEAAERSGMSTASRASLVFMAVLTRQRASVAGSSMVGTTGVRGMAAGTGSVAGNSWMIAAQGAVTLGAGFVRVPYGVRCVATATGVVCRDAVSRQRMLVLMTAAAGHCLRLPEGVGLMAV
jgi:hypothetical protein